MQAVLSAKWQVQLQLQLSGCLLLTLTAPGLLLAADVIGSTAAAAGAPGSSDAFDSERIARTAVHGVQLVLVVGLLISEVIIQQHTLLLGGVTPLAGDAGVAGRGSYQRLPGGDLEAPAKMRRWCVGLCFCWGGALGCDSR